MYPRNDSIVKSAHHRATLLGLAALAAGVVLLLGLLGKAFAQSGGLDCSGAIASTVHLWPPNHAMVPVAINGVTDPDGGPVHIAITGITQDEPLAGAMPDGMVDRNGVAWVRATRSSSGNGRVYHIAFVATDDHGGRCDGEVAVCVPHDQRSEGACVDDGQAFNSLGSGPGPTPPPSPSPTPSPNPSPSPSPTPPPGPNPNPPIPIIDQCRCSGTVFVRTAAGGLSTAVQTVDITEVSVPLGSAPRDTCPMTSRLDVRWHAEPSDVIGYRYRLAPPHSPLDQPPFTEVGPEVTSLSDPGAPPDTMPPTPGIEAFTLGAIDSSHVERDTTRTFQLDFAPDTWWSGPDLSSSSLTTLPNGVKFALLVNGKLTSPISGSLLSGDSVQVMPALRTQRLTFFEIWKDTVYARQEGDTVHFNSWVIVHNGGFDRDSRYAVRVTEAGRQLPDFPGGPVLQPGPANGSPIGFRSLLVMSVTPDDSRRAFAQTGLYPIYDPNDVFNKPQIAEYHPILFAGRAFVTAQAEDADGFRDNRIQSCCGDGRGLVISIENGTATPYEQTLRSKVLTFYTDYPPYFVTSSPQFSPRTTQVDTFKTSVWALRLVANDDDPWSLATSTGVGGPGPVLTLRRRITIHGKDLHGNALALVDPNTYLNQESIQETVPDTLAGGPCTVEVQLCDCQFCEDQPGTGRCVTLSIPVFYQPPSGAASATSRATLAAAVARTALLATYPNPASDGVTIRFSLAAAGAANLEIYSLAGRLVRRVAAERFTAGEHSSRWDGLDGSSRRVGAGIYFVRLRAGGTTVTQKFFVAG